MLYHVMKMPVLVILQYSFMKFQCSCLFHRSDIKNVIPNSRPCLFIKLGSGSNNPEHLFNFLLTYVDTSSQQPSVLEGEKEVEMFK